jgi:hypothetical protein
MRDRNFELLRLNQMLHIVTTLLQSGKDISSPQMDYNQPFVLF